jgi:hypothetical protein
MKLYIKTMTDLKKTTVAWEVAQTKPVKNGKKPPARPTTRRVSMSMQNPKAGVTKVDKIEYLTQR